MPDITVSAADLCAAVRAVVPHADARHPDDDQTYCRVRFTIAGENLHVYATQRVTVALALVSILDHGTGEAGSFDLTVHEAKELVQLFKPSKSHAEVGDDLLVEFDTGEVKVTDIGGLVPGKSTTWPMSLHDGWADIEALVGKHVHAGVLHSPPDAWWTAGRFAGLFTTASIVYRDALRFAWAAPKTLLVSCGESFIGVLSVSPVPPGADDDSSGYDEAAWRARLPARSRRPDPQATPATDGGDSAEDDEADLVAAAAAIADAGLHVVPS